MVYRFNEWPPLPSPVAAHALRSDFNLVDERQARTVEWFWGIHVAMQGKENHVYVVLSATASELCMDLSQLLPITTHT